MEELAPIIEAFHHNDRYSAHENAGRILEGLAADPQFLYAIFRQALQDPAFINRTRHHPVIAIDAFRNDDFQLVAHLWYPLADRQLDLSHQSIHHHGNLLLTSVSPFGPGYESFLFSRDYDIDYKTGVTRMEIDKIYHNPRLNREFVDVFTPHVVFFPPSLSITYALWSTDRKRATDQVPRSFIPRAVKTPLRKILQWTGLADRFGVNTVQYFDFYPDGDRLMALKKRVFGYKDSTNDNFLQNIFHALQETGFDDEDFIRDLLRRPDMAGQPALQTWGGKLLAGESIPDQYVPHHKGIGKVNFLREEVLRVCPLRTDKGA